MIHLSKNFWSNSLLICVIVISFTSIGYSQIKTEKVELTWGEEFKASKRMSHRGLVLSDETGIYNLVVEGGFFSELKLQKFTPNMSLIKSEPMNFRAIETVVDLKWMLPWNDKLYAFTTLKDARTDKYFLFRSEFDKESLEEVGFADQVAEMESVSGLLRRKDGNYEYRTSRDETKFMVFYNRPYEKGESEKMGFKVFQGSMELMWESEIELPYNDELFSLERIRVGNDGKVYIVGKVYAERSTVERGEPNFHLVILAYDQNSATPNEYQVKTEGKFLTDMQITIADNGDIICGGFYSEERTSSIKGSFFLTVDGTSKKIRQQSFKEFGLDFITMGMKERHEKRTNRKAEKGKNIELIEYELNEIIQREDGGALLIGEQFWINVVTTTSAGPNGTTSTTTTYYYNYLDIIIINIDPSGEIEWYQKIPKNQITTNDGGMYSSYALKVMKDRLYFIINDHPENLYYTSGEPAGFSANRRHMIPTLITVDEVGNVEREALLNKGDSDFYLRPKIMRNTSEDVMMAYCQQRKTHQLLKIRFK